MATRRVSRPEPSEPSVRRTRPARTPKEREDELIGLAIDLTERQMRDGTASSQVITHYLKLGSSRERLEQERIANENLLVAAKIEAMASQKRVEELYENALNAMRSYQGNPIPPPESDFDEDY